LLINQGRGTYYDDEEEEESLEEKESKAREKEVSVPIVCGYCFKTTIFNVAILARA